MSSSRDGRRVGATLLAAALLGSPAACGSGAERSDSAEPIVSTAPTAGLTDDLMSVLRRAVQEERGAKATYDNVLARFGQVRPFAAIAQSESRHILALEKVAGAHGIDVSRVDASGQTSPATLPAACAMGAEAEQADVRLYDELLTQVQEYPDVVRTFTNLREASQNSHLPAFQRCRGS